MNIEIKIGVVRFPGSNCDLDTVYVLRNVLGVSADLVWHKDKLEGFDGIILPGGFAYGDALRAGIIAAYSPVIQEVKTLAREGIPVAGICNGFQVLIEAGLLPGALLPNDGLKFICKWINLRVEHNDTAFTNIEKKGGLWKLPIAHGEGRYFADKTILKELHENNQIVFLYTNDEGKPTEDANPNASLDSIAGICNLERNVLGLMPHPERGSEKTLSPYRTDHGKRFFQSMIEYIRKGVA